MGGLALKNTYTRRYEKDEFDALWEEMSTILGKTFKLFDLPLYYHNKESFGDMDIIISREGFDGNIADYVKETFNPNDTFSNGNAYSFDYKELQIDFIMVQPEDFMSNYHYLAFNDLGNFIGRIAQQLGLKYGQEGLWYNHHVNGGKHRIPISKDYPEIFKFLDLDYKKWLEGFNTLEEIFEYVMTSKYFNPFNFQMSQLNKINRDRNLKRKSYMSFLEYIDNKEPNAQYDQDKVDEMKMNIIDVIQKEFPESNIQMEVKRIEYEQAKKAYASMKFNGKLVMERYDLKGKELGEAIKHFKEYIYQEYCNVFMDYHDVIIAYEDEEIWEIFEECNELV